MTRTLRQRKSDLRRALAARIDALAPAVRQRHDTAIRNRALALPELAAAGACLGYVPLPDEIDTLPLVQTLLERGVHLGLPRVEAEAGAMAVHAVTDLHGDLATGTYGVREPRADLPRIAPDTLDVILVPGRAFATDGRRLGRGAGYYDRFLAGAPALRVALAYEEQILDDVPADEHDLPVHVLITPERILRIA